MNNEVNDKCSYKAKLCNPKNSPNRKVPNSGNLSKLGRTRGWKKIWSRPTMPYKLHFQYDRTRNFIGYPNNRISWARIVNRKTYNAQTNMLIEDLDVTPDVPIEVILRPLPDGATHIKTVFEYGGMPTHTGTKMMVR